MLVAASLFVFLLIGLLLLIGHPGFAIKVANYFYFILVLAILIELRNYASKK